MTYQGNLNKFPKYLDKECKHHGLTSFRYRSDTHKYSCIKCQEECKQKRKAIRKDIALEMFGSKCNICGYDKCKNALEFHHLDPDKKDVGISYSYRSRSLERLKKELEKCILLCANCHREVHSNELNLKVYMLQYSNFTFYETAPLNNLFYKVSVWSKLNLDYIEHEWIIVDIFKTLGYPCYTKNCIHPTGLYMIEENGKHYVNQGRVIGLYFESVQEMIEDILKE